MSQDRFTKLARGAVCQVRVPLVCNGIRETVVAAHYRSISLGAGVGIKPEGWLAAHACSARHDVIDGRIKSDYSHEELRQMLAEGVLRTLLALVRAGKLFISTREIVES